MADGTHIDLGHAMITMVEPTRDPERLREYNRWYEHDHAYSGVLVGPRAFSFGRFVATKDLDRKSTRLNSSHSSISYAVFCLKKKTKKKKTTTFRKTRNK